VLHTYEAKSARVRPDTRAFTITVTATWLGRYRVDGGTWQNLGTFRTTAALDYPVIEVVTRLVG
jgi:hypothetical protein